MALLKALSKSFRSVQLLSSAQLNVRQFGAASHHHHEEEEDDHHHHGPTPTVFDRTITINVLDLKGKKHSVRALVDKPLSEALVEYGFPETYFFPNMGYLTQHIVDAHVFIPQDFWKNIPNIDPRTEEADAIKMMFRDVVQEFQRDTSFFASYINVSKDMDKMTIGFGPIKPWILHSSWCFDGNHGNPARMFDRVDREVHG